MSVVFDNGIKTVQLLLPALGCCVLFFCNKHEGESSFPLQDSNLFCVNIFWGRKVDGERAFGWSCFGQKYEQKIIENTGILIKNTLSLKYTSVTWRTIQKILLQKSKKKQTESQFKICYITLMLSKEFGQCFLNCGIQTTGRTWAPPSGLLPWCWWNNNIYSWSVSPPAAPPAGVSE